VYQVRKKDDGKIYALKCLKKHLVKQENKVKHVMNEKSILSIVDHPFIVKMNWAFQAVISTRSNFLGSLFVHGFRFLCRRGNILPYEQSIEILRENGKILLLRNPSCLGISTLKEHLL